MRRTSPDLWTSNFLDNLKGYLSIYGLGSTDSSKVFKANHYFKNSKDPFSFNIGPEYSDILVELCLAPVIMSNNEKIFTDFVRKIEEKYVD